MLCNSCKVAEISDSASSIVNARKSIYPTIIQLFKPYNGRSFKRSMVIIHVIMWLSGHLAHHESVCDKIQVRRWMELLRSFERYREKKNISCKHEKNTQDLKTFCSFTLCKIKYFSVERPLAPLTQRLRAGLKTKALSSDTIDGLLFCKKC